MNNDCLATIYNFMQTSQVVKLSKDSAVERFPKKLALTSVTQIDEFNRWCGKFDTSRLEEVLINIPMREFTAARGLHIGVVPPSVKHLTIHDDNFSVLEVSSTVEVLVIERSQQRHINLPDGIRKLVLGKGFCGSIRTFPANLEELTILNWDQPWGFDASTPHKLTNIPDTVHTIEIGEAAPVLVGKWPASLEVVVLPKMHWGVSAWIDRSHLPIPDGVLLEIKEPTPLAPVGALARQYADPWWEDELERLSPAVVWDDERFEWETDY
jgi:hypothetical protein